MLSSELVRKKLEHLQSTQEGIETVSLWCLHHKNDASLIVSTWLQIFKNAEKEKQRLSLFYLANDVCQKGRKKKGHDYLNIFIPALKEACLLSRNESIRQSIERILNIWEERNVYDAATVKEFKNLLEISKTGTNDFSISNFIERQQTPPSVVSDNEKIMNDFSLNNLISESERHQKVEQNIERLRVLLPTTSLACDGNMKSLLKSRQEGQRFIDDINQTHKKWTEFVDECERRLKRHHQLIIALERAQIFYETQLNEAGIVQTAYEKFGAGVKSVGQKLNKMQKTGNYNYTQSPDDAPSPNPYDDPFGGALGGSAATASKKDTDKMETIDMDLDDHEDVKYGSNNTTRSAVSQEAAIGGMKIATNQSFFNDPPPAMSSNGAGFNISESPSKKMKMDPRQQKTYQSTPPLTGGNTTPIIPTHSLYPEYPSAAQSNESNWLPPPSGLASSNVYPSTYGSQPTTPNVAMQSPPPFHHHYQMQPHHPNYGSVVPPPPPPPPPPIPPLMGVGNHPYAGGTTSSNDGGKVFEYDHGTTSSGGQGSNPIGNKRPSLLRTDQQPYLDTKPRFHPPDPQYFEPPPPNHHYESGGGNRQRSPRHRFQGSNNSNRGNHHYGRGKGGRY